MIEIKDLTKVFDNHVVLDNISFVLPDNGLVYLEGENGCGKTTLLNIIDSLDNNYQGSVLFNSNEMKSLNDKQRAYIRGNDISYVFQKHNLINYLNIDENINLEKILRHEDYQASDDQKWFPLSEGQQELVALKRGLKEGKKIYLLDEVTTSLDTVNKVKLLDQVKKLAKTALVIMVCHDHDIKGICDINIKIVKGKLSVIKEAAVDTEKNEATETIPTKFKSKKHIRLFLREYFNNGILHFLNILSAVMILFFAWLGVSAAHSDTFFLALQSFPDNSLISFSERHAVSQKDILEMFPDNVFAEVSSFDKMLGYSSNVPDDGQVHCNSKTKKEKSMYLRDGNYIDHNGVSYSVSVDDDIQANLFLIYDANNGVIKPADDLNMFPNGRYYNVVHNLIRDENHYGCYYSLGGVDFIDEEFYHSRYGKTLDFELKDDTIYSYRCDFSENQEISFEYSDYNNINEEYCSNLAELFPSGAKIGFIDDPNLVKSLPMSTTFVVSDKFMKKIIDDQPIKKSLFISLHSNRWSILSYMAFHNFSLSGATIRDTTNAISNYNKIVAYNTNPANFNSYNIFAYLMPVILLLIEITVLLGLIYLNQKNDHILISLGLTGKQVSRWHVLEILADVILAMIISGILCFAFVTVSNAFSFLTTAVFFSVPWLLVIAISYILVLELTWRLNDRK
ncbi:MAG: ATP-binding cassette domain-containing protein [Bacilli bacterium]